MIFRVDLYQNIVSAFFLLFVSTILHQFVISTLCMDYFASIYCIDWLYQLLVLTYFLTLYICLSTLCGVFWGVFFCFWFLVLQYVAHDHIDYWPNVYTFVRTFFLASSYCMSDSIDFSYGLILSTFMTD